MKNDNTLKTLTAAGLLALAVACEQPAQNKLANDSYMYTIEVQQKYLLLPIENEATEVKMQLLVENTPIGEPINIRIAQNQIDYWIPIEIEAYKGKKLTLSFNEAQNARMGFSKIKQTTISLIRKNTVRNIISVRNTAGQTTLTGWYTTMVNITFSFNTILMAANGEICTGGTLLAKI